MKALLCTFAVILGVGQGATAADDPPRHWAFQAPTRPPVPSPRQLLVAKANPVDAFIGAEHEKRGLKAAPEARKEVLLRRVCLDLVGLPPTRQELHAFLADDSADAYEKVVDRLLASRQYAERWARHWMDIWRYADWYGRRHVPDVWNSAPQVWRWRDWIVRSLDADKGYDQMVTEMLAADEIAPEDDDTRVATGYLVRNWYALNPNQWMRDTVEHTGKAFLGLTFNCAHCHDHKYDPITQRDYFQFRAFFEPLQVRQDWVKGEADPGPFQKYEYSTPRKVITNGMVTVFDENLEAKTFIYLRGDERTLPEGKPTAEPAMPAFLGGDKLKAGRLDLPAVARNPGLKPFIREAETQALERALAAAQNACIGAEKEFTDARARLSAGQDSLSARARAVAALLTTEVTWRRQSNQVTVARAELDALRARIAADEARYCSSQKSRPKDVDGSHSGSEPTPTASTPADELAAVAGRAERIVALRKAEAKLTEAEDGLTLWQGEQSLAAARRAGDGATEKKEDKDKAEAALKAAQDRVTAAKTKLEAAQATLLTNTTTTYRALSQTYPAQSTGRRRALAEWMVSRDNPLTARVAVNHIWARHFHTPLVASIFDFGRNGARPTHPELLDWLAVEFMEQGWRMKPLHRLLVTSLAYRRASAPAEDGINPPEHADASASAPPPSKEAAADPENRFLWRMNPGQMEAEVLRDSILYLAGELDPAPVGYPIPNALAEKDRHRSLYFECFPEPNGASQFAELFDPPNPSECYRRTQTIVPQQALALTNSKLSRDRSRALARRLADGLPLADPAGESRFITAAYEQILTRRPTRMELAACQEFCHRQSAATNPEAARVSLVHALFSHNDFIAVR